MRILENLDCFQAINNSETQWNLIDEEYRLFSPLGGVGNVIASQTAFVLTSEIQHRYIFR